MSGDYDETHADIILEGESGGDQVRPAEGVGDLDGDGFNDMVVGAYQRTDSGGSNKNGEAYILYGPLPGSDSVARDVANVVIT